MDIDLGMRIRIRRKALGLSQVALATWLSVTFQQVQKYERGTTRPTTSTLARVARLLDTSTDQLLGEADSNGSVRAVAKPLHDEAELPHVVSDVHWPAGATSGVVLKIG